MFDHIVEAYALPWAISLHAQIRKSQKSMQIHHDFNTSKTQLLVLTYATKECT